MQRYLLVTVVLLAAGQPAASGQVDLAQGFATPPDACKVWTYWWWLNGYVSQDGILRDLDDMQKRGISGALVFHAGQGTTPESTEFMSRKWREFFRFAVEQAARRNITVGLNLCAGWNAGGPWVAAPDAAKLLVHSTTSLSGPRAVDEVLDKPPGADETYHDVAVLAWPIAEPINNVELTASSSFRNYGPDLAMDGDASTRWVSSGNRPGQGPRPDRPEFLQWRYPGGFSAAAVHIVPHRDCGPRDCELQAADDNGTYRVIGRFQVEQGKPQTFKFPETSARAFRLVVTSSHPHKGQDNWNVQISEAVLLQKGEDPGPSGRRVAKCASRGVRDLTDRMDRTGRLNWQAPEGHWLVLRFGWRVHDKAHTKCTGGERHLEIDPLSAAAMDKQFAATAGVVIDDVAAHVGKTFKYVHLDSGEIGEPDWTPRFRADFQRLRGYDPMPCLAAKAGHIVDDAATTERFLEDYERTVGDLLIECYYGRLGELARRRGLLTHSEAAGYQKPTVDALRSLGCNDICMSEFWSRRLQDPPYIHQLAAAQLRYHDGIKNASSAAHTYGRKIVQAEAFTVMRKTNYDQDPFDLKDVGDRAFCNGLNRNMLCFYVSQPEEQSKPGYEWPGVGMEFDRHVTWWPMSSAWLTYLARCQHLLQAGRFVGDICYFQGEWTPAYVPAKWAMDPPLPPGFDCDTINAEALTARAAAGNDRSVVLPDGQSYRYLVLGQGGRWQRPSREIFAAPSADAIPPTCPPTGSAKPLAFSPATLAKLKELIEAGVTVIGPRPQRAVGLTRSAQSDSEVKRLADAIWGANPADRGARQGERRVGRGRVIWGRSLAEVLRADGVAPDLEIHESPGTRALPPATLSGIPHPGSFDWIHRTIDNSEVYFVANLRNAVAQGAFVFRVAGRQPELWDAVTGSIRNLPAFREEGGRTSLSLVFAPRQSFFVVFRKPREMAATAISTSHDNFPPANIVAELAGAWEVSFDPKWGGPAKVVFETLQDWTARPEDGIKHYSGTATYRKLFDLPSRVPAAPFPLYLDLGTVKNLAEVRLNGTSLGVVWTAPWRVDIAKAVRGRGNELEVVVVNLWPNRLIGDAAQAPEKRFTKTNAARFTPEMPLLPSGLLGPVTLQTRHADGAK